MFFREPAAPSTERGRALVAFANARRSGAVSVRDAAHEAFHVLAGVATSTMLGEQVVNWERERIHARLLRRFRRPVDLWVHEMEARAVEQAVCAMLGENAGGTIDEWVMMSVMEAISFRLPHGAPDGSLHIASAFSRTEACRMWAEKITGLTTKGGG